MSQNVLEYLFQKIQFCGALDSAHHFGLPLLWTCKNRIEVRLRLKDYAKMLS